MNKKLLLGLFVIIVLPIAYWLISPLWKNVALNEPLPTSTTPAIEDNLLSMDEPTKVEFEKQTTELKTKVMKKAEAMPPSGPTTLRKAPMVARAHDVEGEALLVTAGNETFLRFENLNTINGPDLRIYLSVALNADDVVDLGPIRATEGSVNYAIPAGTDTNKYRNAMIWCRAFGVLFSYAEL